MKRTQILTWLAAGLLLAVGCTKFDEAPDNGPAQQGTEVTVRLAFDVAAQQAGGGDETRAPQISDVEDAKVCNVWVFQFGEDKGAGDDSRVLVIAPRYIDRQAIEGGTIEMNLIESAGQQHLVAFVANTNNASQSWGMQPGCATYADLKRQNIAISQGEEAILYGGDTQDIAMSGAVETVVAAGTPIQCTLTRSLAKVELNLTVDAARAAGYKVVSVQLKNAQNRLWLTDALNGHSDTDLFPVVAFPAGANQIIDLPIVKDTADGLADAVRNASTPAKFIWYIPRNTRGDTGNTVVKDRNLDSPAGATYVEIVARDEATGNGAVYRVYLGADNLGDFNVLPNHKYVIDQHIVGDGGDTPTDSRIEQFRRDKLFDGSNNSFILNPSLDGMGARRFHIPVTRVNQYWRPTAAGYGSKNSDQITPTTEWEVFLLWQDAAGIFRSTAAPDYDPAKFVTLSKATGTGEDAAADGCFTLTVPDGAVHGNFVVALKIAGSDNIWWSWHFWLTDYNPDKAKAEFKSRIEGKRFTYPAPGGQVERYGGTLWGYSGAATNNWNDYTYAVTTASSTAPYAESFMMDRSVGALSTAYTGSARGALYYQFGRKDPLPGGIALYDDAGAAIGTTPGAIAQQYWNSTNANAVNKPTGVVVQNAVQNPMVFYANTADWSGLNETTSATAYNIWQDTQLYSTNATVATEWTNQNGRFGKSIYDPCPAGWRLPLNGAYQDFRNNITANNTSRGLTYALGLMYWPVQGTTATAAAAAAAPVDGRIYFPATGRRNLSGMLANVGGGDGYYWSSMPNNSAGGYYLLFNSGGVGPSNTSNRGDGSFVRCVSY